MLHYTIVLILITAKLTHSGNFTQEDLVESLAGDGFFEETDVVKKILLQVNRDSYVHKKFFKAMPSKLGFGASFCPLQVTFALETLHKFLREGSKVLDIGSGSGYQAVCMALMVGKTGYVVAVEHIPELLNTSIKDVMRDKPFLLEEKRLRFIEGDGRLGVPELGPYDAIHIGALAPKVPEVLFDQLRPGGRLVIPLDYELAKGGIQYHQLWTYDKDFNGGIKKGLENGFFISNPVEHLQDKEYQLQNDEG